MSPSDAARGAVGAPRLVREKCGGLLGDAIKVDKRPARLRIGRSAASARGRPAIRRRQFVEAFESATARSTLGVLEVDVDDAATVVQVVRDVMGACRGPMRARNV